MTVTDQRGSDAASLTVAPGTTGSARAGGPGAPVSSRAKRVTSRDVADFPTPNGREEEWRFTPLTRLRGLLEARADGETAEPEVVSSVPAGAVLERVPASDARVGSVLHPADLLAAVALADQASALSLTVPAETVLDEPVVLSVKTAEGRSASHLVVELQPFAQATVIVDNTGSGTRAATVELNVADSAKLTFITVNGQDEDAVHAEAQAIRLGRDAVVEHVVVTLGGNLVRLTPTVEFAGAGGQVELSGLFLTSSGQHHEHQLFVDHEVANCRSRVTYKGALQGALAHSVWVGDVHIGADAAGTDTYELNRNLVLTDGARADSVPNLEIETGEVAGAGHASATGRFDDEQLFYFMARGIPAAEARRLVVRGFFAEVLNRINYTPLRERLFDTVDALLDVSDEVSV